MKVLVHTDRWGYEPYGIWWVDKSGAPTSIYLDPDSPQALRGQMLMYAKSTAPGAPSWEEYFDLLTGRAPYFEDFAVYDTVFGDGMEMAPDALLRAMVPGPSELDMYADEQGAA